METKNKRIEDYNKILPIVELYTAIQSEGSRAGYPTIIIRTTGCTHRCYFGEGGWCDSWYTSIHPEKGTFTFNDIIKMYDNNPHIKEMMITGGSPTMHPALVNELTRFAHERHIITTIETEGSHFIDTDYPLDLVSISPKFANSVPVIGIPTPQGDLTTQKMIDQHNKLRLNYNAIAKMIVTHINFHLKPVIDKNLDIIPEYEEFLDKLACELKKVQGTNDIYFDYMEHDEVREYLKNNTWMMPAGDDRPSLFKTYPVVMNYCRDNGYKFTGREHIMAFGTERCV
jgi:7-carboxy-7-deazaguanine synthase